MKHVKKIALACIAIAFFAFTPKPGGEGFEIYLNNNLITQQFGNNMNTVKTLSLTGSSEDKLTIMYYHCGTSGKNRVVTIRNGHGKDLKEYRYADVTGNQRGMIIPLKDLLELNKRNTQLQLFYSSTELIKGRYIATFNGD